MFGNMEPRPSETEPPRQPALRVLFACIGMAFLAFMTISGICGTVWGIRGIIDTASGRYANHFYFACFFYLGLTVGGGLCMVPVYQKVRYLIKNQSWW